MKQGFYRPPNEDERKIIFFCLKQATSLSAWTRLFEYYSEFVDVVKEAHDEEREADTGRGQCIATSTCQKFLDARRSFELALDRLRRGDRSCFRWDFSPGHFSEGMRYAESWTALLRRAFNRGGAFPPMDSPMWPEIWMALRNTMSAQHAVWGVCEPREMDRPAPIKKATYHEVDFDGSQFVWVKRDLARLSDAPRLLPGDPTIIIKTGQTIPVSGIWEPCEAPSTSSIFRRALGQTSRLSSDVIVNPEGCMNYLHQGSNAPTIAFPGDGQRQEGKPISWCLLWVDRRYGKNPVPEEEAMYTYPPVDIHGFPSNM